MLKSHLSCVRSRVRKRACMCVNRLLLEQPQRPSNRVSKNWTCAFIQMNRRKDEKHDNEKPNLRMNFVCAIFKEYQFQRTLHPQQCNQIGCIDRPRTTATENCPPFDMVTFARMRSPPINAWPATVDGVHVCAVVYFSSNFCDSQRNNWIQMRRSMRQLDIVMLCCCGGGHILYERHACSFWVFVPLGWGGWCIEHKRFSDNVLAFNIQHRHTR